MRKFFIQSFLFFAIIISLYALIDRCIKPEISKSNNYMAAIVTKHQRISEIKQPKVVFAGGSNLAFGLDSERIEDELSYPVVNLGLHAGLGVDFLLKELKTVLNSKDVVFLSFEYLLDDGDYNLRKHTSNYFPRAKSFYKYNLSKEISLRIEKTRTNLHEKILNKKPIFHDDTTIYSYKGFNTHGDVIAHLDRESLVEINGREKLVYRYWTEIKKLNRFYKYAEKRGIKVFFLYPPYPKEEYQKNQEVIQRIHKDILQNLKIPVLNNPEEAVIEDHYFFDTIYHLNKEGRKVRTEKVIMNIHNIKNSFETSKDLSRL